MWELNNKKGWVPKNWCLHTVVLEKTLESPLDSKEFKPVNPKGNQPWILIGRTDTEAKAQYFATWCEKLTHWKRPRCWERLKSGGEGGNGGWDGWMASLTQWMWVWTNSRRWWRTGKPGLVRSCRVAKSHTWLSDCNNNRFYFFYDWICILHLYNIISK